ncbi:putative nuclear transcription factor Y subunit B-2 [Iris pallida]|uniref:Nuclear transcription factor Y subunit B-2 n=1 Tax=Iris pallida TaxID=29817 RepID=A0AAX6DJH3_IRIPA|nr:putative nuclear transcription factor Y subunit B-2 [Iris pallida]
MLVNKQPMMKGSRRAHSCHMIGPAGSPPSDSDFPANIGADTTTSSKALEQDRFLPIANVSRIMKRSLPANAKISKEAKETVQECVSEFISFVTGEASDKCQREKRKTINGDDLLWAMTTLGFDNYVGPLKLYLSSYRETDLQGDDRNNSSSSSVVVPRIVGDHGQYSAAGDGQLVADPTGLYPAALGTGGGAMVFDHMGGRINGGGVHGVQW